MPVNCEKPRPESLARCRAQERNKTANGSWRFPPPVATETLPVAVVQIPETGLQRDFEANAAERAAVAELGGLLGVPSAKASLVLTPAGGGQGRAEMDSAALFADFGFSPRANFFGELGQRLKLKLLPRTTATTDLADLFGLLFPDDDDALHAVAIAGLRVREPRDADDPTQPRRPNTEREIEIDPGLAMDRLGRLIELRSTQCFRIRRWFDWTLEHDADALDEAVVGAGADAHVLLDFFVRFVVCQHGATPAFATGPFNATDAVVPSREHDAFELSWVLRPAAEATTRPASAWPSFDSINQVLAAMPQGTPEERAARDQRRAELVGEAILNAWEPLS
eukprot:gene41898-56738_t